MADAVTPAVMARPQPRPVYGRHELLLDAIRARGGQWTTVRVHAFYRTAWPTHVYHSNARRDLCELHAAGHLERHDEGPHRYYTYIAKGAAV